MSKNLENKKQIVEENVEALKPETKDKGFSTVVFNYSGIPSSAINDLRGKLFEQGAKLTVVKNTLIKLVFEKLGVNLEEDLSGQNAILVQKEGDFVSNVKVLFDYIKENEKGEVQLGILDGSILPKDKMEALSKLPSRQELLGQVVGGMVSPIRGFLYAANGVQGNFVRVLNSIQEQKSKGGES